MTSPSERSLPNKSPFATAASITNDHRDMSESLARRSLGILSCDDVPIGHRFPIYNTICILLFPTSFLNEDAALRGLSLLGALGLGT